MLFRFSTRSGKISATRINIEALSRKYISEGIRKVLHLPWSLKQLWCTHPSLPKRTMKLSNKMHPPIKRSMSLSLLLKIFRTTIRWTSLNICKIAYKWMAHLCFYSKICSLLKWLRLYVNHNNLRSMNQSKILGFIANRWVSKVFCTRKEF